MNRESNPDIDDLTSIDLLGIFDNYRPNFNRTFQICEILSKTHPLGDGETLEDIKSYKKLIRPKLLERGLELERKDIQEYRSSVIPSIINRRRQNDIMSELEHQEPVNHSDAIEDIDTEDLSQPPAANIHKTLDEMGTLGELSFADLYHPGDEGDKEDNNSDEPTSDSVALVQPPVNLHDQSPLTKDSRRERPGESSEDVCSCLTKLLSQQSSIISLIRKQNQMIQDYHQDLNQRISSMGERQDSMYQEVQESVGAILNLQSTVDNLSDLMTSKLPVFSHANAGETDSGDEREDGTSDDTPIDPKAVSIEKMAQYYQSNLAKNKYQGLTSDRFVKYWRALNPSKAFKKDFPENNLPAEFWIAVKEKATLSLLKSLDDEILRLIHKSHKADYLPNLGSKVKAVAAPLILSGKSTDRTTKPLVQSISGPIQQSKQTQDLVDRLFRARKN